MPDDRGTVQGPGERRADQVRRSDAAEQVRELLRLLGTDRGERGSVSRDPGQAEGVDKLVVRLSVPNQVDLRHGHVLPEMAGACPSTGVARWHRVGQRRGWPDLVELVEEVVDAPGGLGLWIDPAHFGRTLMAVHREYRMEIRPDGGRGIVATPAQGHRPVGELTSLRDHTGAGHATRIAIANQLEGPRPHHPQTPAAALHPAPPAPRADPQCCTPSSSRPVVAAPQRARSPTGYLTRQPAAAWKIRSGCYRRSRERRYWHFF